MTTTPQLEDLLDEAPDRRVWQRLLVATDLSARCEEMLSRSIEIARAVGASIDLVHVRERFGRWVLQGSSGPSDDVDAARQSIDRSLEDIGQRITESGVTCHTTTLEGSPAHQIVAHAAKTGADLIVLGSRGHGGILQTLLGNLARRVSRKATCAVIVIPVADRPAPPGQPPGRCR